MSEQMSNGARTVMMIVVAAIVLGGIGWGVDALIRRSDLADRIGELARAASRKTEPPPAPAPAPPPTPVTETTEAPAPPPRDEEPVRVGGEVSALPQPLQRVPPQYTEVARRARIQGVVILEAEIDREGRVTSTRVLKGLPMGLSEEAEKALAQWRFVPAHRGGEPVPSLTTVTINFRLE
jgi:TonB family protein